VVDVVPPRHEIAQRIAAVSAGRYRRPVLVLGIDGAYVPTRPDSARKPCEGQRRKRAKRARWRGQWRDAKGCRFSLLDGERILQVLSGHQVQNEEQLGEALKQVKEAIDTLSSRPENNAEMKRIPLLFDLSDYSR
jgi:hypothetical protein